MILSESSNLIFKSRYAIHENETWQELSERVAQGGAQVEQNFQYWKDMFSSDIYDMRFLPGGRILRNVGRPRGTLFNCYVEPLDDSMKQIGQFQMNCGVLWSEGGGVGCNASFLRPENAPIIQKGGESSGPISFLKWANAGANCIKTGGARRAAALAMMNVDHPDIIKFINAKLVDGELNCFNISAAVTEDFLQAVEAYDDWDLVWKTKVGKTVKAREIWNLILENMVKCAEPGLINWDNLRSNNSYYFDPIISTNPCITGDTLIAVADGRNGVSIETLATEGKDIPVYSTNKNGKVEIKIGRNPRKTGIKKEVWKITLDDGSTFKSTPDHKILTKELKYKEIKNLNIGESIFPFNSFESNGYRQIQNVGKKMIGGARRNKRQYRLIYEFFNGKLNPKKYHIHHKDFNSINDNPCNLEKLLWNDHKKIHTEKMIGKNNPYHRMSDEWKLKFATHKGKKNGRCYKNISNNDLIEVGKKLYNDIGKFTKKIWFKFAKENGYPLNIATNYRFKNFSNFKSLVISNHKITSIEFYGYEDVYNITVDDNHNYHIITSNEDDNFITSSGICIKNCGEVPLGAHGVCCLGSLVLPNFITGTKNTNWQLMERTVHNAIRFLDNIIQINRYVIEDIKRKAFDGRRIGLGVMGLAEYLFAKRVRYGSKEATRVITTLMENIRNFAYEASCKIAKEKEPFPKFDVKEYSKAHFFKTLPAFLRMSIKKHGMRNVSVMAVAPTGCQEKNTMIVTNKGILSLEEIGNVNGEEWQNINLKVSQEKYNEEKDAIKFYINGEANTKKIYLKSGNVLESTYNHQYRVLEEVIGIGTYVWKRADELKVGDDIVSVLNTYNKNTNPDLLTVNVTHGNQNNIKQINSINEKLAEFLGIYFGDGSNHNKGIRINCNAINEEEYSYVAELGEEIFGIKPTFSDNGRNCMSVCFNSKLILKFLELNGLLKQKSNKISIPKIIRESSKNCINSFIKGLLFADGSKSGNNIYLDTSSEKLSKELLVIMRALGTDVKIQEHISGLGSKIFRIWFKKGVYKYRPLKEKKKKEQLEKLGLYYCITDEIVKIEDSRNYTYDIEVPSTVTYIANSVVSHNTISLLPEVTSSIEPLFCKAYLRKDEISDRAYIHPIYKKIIEKNQSTPDWYVDSFNLKPEDHFETQVAVQKYLDASVSKTINCPKGFKPEQLSELLLEYIRDLKGVTLYVDGSREGQILNPMTKKDAKKYIIEGKTVDDIEERDCSTGSCEI